MVSSATLVQLAAATGAATTSIAGTTAIHSTQSATRLTISTATALTTSAVAATLPTWLGAIATSAVCAKAIPCAH